MTKVGQPSGALAQRELERRNRGELAPETQEFDRFTAAAPIGDAASFTESVVEVVRCRYSGCKSRIHMRISVSKIRGMRKLCRLRRKLYSGQTRARVAS